MAQIKLVIGHNLPQDVALARTKELLTETMKEHKDRISNVVEEWNGNKGDFTLLASDSPVKGAIEVGKTAVCIVTEKLPFKLGLFKGTIESAIKEQAHKVLSEPVEPAASSEPDPANQAGETDHNSSDEAGQEEAPLPAPARKSSKLDDVRRRVDALRKVD